MIEGFGKIFPKTFTGSMYGAGANVFAVWFYCIANAQPPDGEVEINPEHVAPMIGITTEEVCDAIDYLLKEDPYSRTEAEGGRRLVGMQEMYRFRVVTFPKYRGIGGNQAEYQRLNRERQRRFREKKGDHVTESVTLPNVTNVIPASASASVSVQGREGTGGEGPANHPSLEKCIEHFSSMGSDYTESEVKAAFDHFQSVAVNGDWINYQGRVISDWRCAVSDTINHRRSQTGGKSYGTQKQSKTNQGNSSRGAEPDHSKGF